MADIEEDKTENINEYDRIINEFYGEDDTVKDLSDTRLTAIPATLFKKTELTKLNVSDNNIQAIQIDIFLLKNLKYLNLARNGLRCSNPEDVTIFPRELTRLYQLEYLDISENSLAFIPNVIWNLTSLKYLDISRNKVMVLPVNVGNLDKLIWLNCQHMGLTAIPDEIVGCQSLETILLYGNKIVILPQVLADIPNLKSLSLNIREMSESIDSSTLSLFQTGQIRSDHISNTIYNFPSIESLDLAYCNINHLKPFHLHKLKELHLKGNFFKEVPDPIVQLLSLEFLDLSDNMIQKIIELNLTKNSESDSVKIWPNLKCLLLQNNLLEQITGKIFQLKSLEIFNLNNNKLDHIDIQFDGSSSHLKSLFISHNRLRRFPLNIHQLTFLQNLDVSNNMITELPLELCKLRDTLLKTHQYNDSLYRRGLWLFNNPIVFPPKSIWHTTQIEGIFNYLEKIKLQRINKKTPVRIVIVGSNESIKLSFVSKLLFHSNVEVKSNQFISIYRWFSPNKLPFVLILLNSNPIYKMLWKYFIDDNSLILIVNDNSNRVFNDDLKYWIKFAKRFSDNSVFQMININDAPVEELDIELASNNQEQEVQSISEIEKETETKEESNMETQEDLLYEEFREFCILNNVKYVKNVLYFDINSPNLSFDEFINELEYNAVNKDLFVEDSTFVILHDKADQIEKRCKITKSIFYLNTERFIEKISKDLFMDMKSVVLSLKILHKQGKILWFNHNDRVKSRIYPFINRFIKGIVELLRSNYSDELDILNNPLLKSEALINEITLNDIKFNFYNYGEISLPFYKILTLNSGKSLDIKDFLIDIGFCWCVPILYFPTESIFTRPYVVFPQMNTTPVDPNYLKELTKEFIEIDCSIKITGDTTKDLLEIFINLVCYINDSVEQRYDWNNCVYGLNELGKILILKSDDNINLICLTNNFYLGYNNSMKFDVWLKEWLFNHKWSDSIQLSSMDCADIDTILKEYVSYK